MNTAHPGPYAAIPHWQRPITRRPGEVQFGVLEGGPIVSGVTPDEARLLARLDGTMPPDALDLVARSSGVSKRRWRVLLDLVMRLGLLEPAPARGSDALVTAPAQTAAGGSHVLVDGEGALAEDLRQLLEGDTVVPPDGAGGAAGARRPAGAGETIEAGFARGARDPEGTARRSGRGGLRGPTGARDAGARQESLPGAVVLVADIALDPRRGDLWLQRGVPHLPVVTTGARAVVGPLVDGSAGSPCLWCLDLHRTDRDAAWPTVMAQVATLPVQPVAALEPVAAPEPVAALEAVIPLGPWDPAGPTEPARHRVSAEGATDAAAGPRGGPGREPSGVPGLSQLAAGTVASLVARTLAGDPPPPGVAVEVSVPWPRIDHRRWRPHPRCRHHLRGSEPGPA